MSSISFPTAKKLTRLIDEYFTHIEGEFHLEKASRKTGADKNREAQKIWDRVPEPATITGLAFYLGFNSIQEFEEYEVDGKFAHILQRACLRIEAIYEKRLHRPSPAAAIFVLKNRMGRNGSPGRVAGGVKNLNVTITNTGPEPAANEKEVKL